MSTSESIKKQISSLINKQEELKIELQLARFIEEVEVGDTVIVKTNDMMCGYGIVKVTKIDKYKVDWSLVTEGECSCGLISYSPFTYVIYNITKQKILVDSIEIAEETE